MFFMNPIVFWIFVTFGALCGLGTIAVTIWYKTLKKPTNKQFDLKYRLFQWFFTGFLIFCFTPIFFWLLSLPV